MLTLFQGPRVWGEPNLSPFCTKVELFLRVNGIDYKTAIYNPFKAPKGKMPYIDYNGRLLGDSQVILETLSKDCKIDMDSHLSVDEKAVGHAVRRMLEEATYFCAFYHRWAIDENWQHLRPIIFGNLPPPVKWILPSRIRAKALASIKGQGTGRHTVAEAVNLATQDAQAVTNLLGKKTYLFGDKMSSFDCTVFAFANALLKTDLPQKITVPESVGRPLLDYCGRISKAYFADLSRSAT